MIYLNIDYALKS